MIDAYLRFVRIIRRHVSPTALLVLAGVIFVASIVGVAGRQSESSSRSTTTTSTSSSAPTPTSGPPVATTTTGMRTPIEGFQTVAFTVTHPDRPPVPHCGMLASTNEQLAKGMMGQHDLRGFDGMIFQFASSSTAAFYMANVPVPLSVAWFDDAGNFVSATDMTVCTVEASKCPLYQATGPYRYALETLQGGLGSLDVGPGSTISVGAPGSCA